MRILKNQNVVALYGLYMFDDWHDQSYLPGAGDTMISKVVPPDRGLTIALRFG